MVKPLTGDDPREVAGYQLRARLGAGGMGRVYLGLTRGGRPLAIKVVQAEFGDDEEFRDRFRQEVVAAQRVHGLYTAQVIDADPDAPQPWLATAYVPGLSLQQAVTEHGPLPPDSVFLLIAGVAEALQAIHAAGIVHRDLKPSNVILAADGPRVIDFGIAWAASAPALIRSGISVGSPPFMAPEQARGQPATPMVDVFALGSLATYAVAGHPPFGVDGAVQVLYRVLNAPPNLDGCPPDLQQLIGRCLAKDPSQRPKPAEIVDSCRARTVDGGLAFERSWLPAAVFAVAVGGTAAPFAPLLADSGNGRQVEAAAESTFPSEIGHSSEGPADEGTSSGPVHDPPEWSSAAFQQPGPDPGRYLVGELPSRVRVGKEISLVVSITTTSPETGLAAATLKGLFPGPQGVRVTLMVRADGGLLTLEDLQQTVVVPQHGDSPPVRFAFRARAVGLSRVRVTSWLGGTFLAEMRLEVSVEPEESAADSQRRSTPVGALRADPGEVTLQVHSDGQRYSFQLLSQKYLFGPVMAKSLTEEPGQAVERTVAMLRKMAADASGYTPKIAARWVRETGTGLWHDLVPKLIQDQFWQLRDSITSFNIACEDDKVPWELLYPLTPAEDAGFLVEQFPVLRRVYDQCRSDHILLGDAQYVVPPGSPRNAEDEVAAISRILGRPAGSAITDLADLLNLLDAGSTGLLHFACHNTFSLEAGGSSIKMVGGAFVPQLLNSAVGRRCLADRSPLIFINACRSAGTSAEYTQMMGWASQFMAAGAGAFIGTLWPVRSSQASLFAETFYGALTAGADLGRASLTARQAAKDDADPTWLAYTAYGDPAALGASQL